MGLKNCLVIYVPNTSRVPRRRKLKPLTRKRQDGKSEREVEKYIEEFEENQHKEYMKIKIELGEVASVKLEQSDLAWEITAASSLPKVPTPVNHRLITDNKLTFMNMKWLNQISAGYVPRDGYIT